MALWGVRRTVYKVGVVVQHLGFLLFVVGFSTPYWFYASPGEGSQGLWQYCNGRCHKLQVEEEWFEAVRALLCLTLIVYLMACALAVSDNCLKKYDPLTYTLSRRIEITTAAAGLMGAVGLSVYSVMMEVDYQEYSRSHFGPSYSLTIAGFVLALLAAVLLSATGSSLLQTEYVTLRTPAGHSVVVMYQATSPNPHANLISPSTPSWNPAPPPPPPPTLASSLPQHSTSYPSYLSKQLSTSGGFQQLPVEYSDPSAVGYNHHHYYPTAPMYYDPGQNPEGSYASTPPPYPLPSPPSTSRSFTSKILRKFGKRRQSQV